MSNFFVFASVLVILFIVVMYIIKQIKLSRELSLKDTTLDGLEEKLKKHKLIGGRHKRTNKKNPPIV
ncbi:MAG: hypothetical protein Ct9H90mP18_04030 [Gammaproteobacteria bacterium]|nr:MAG: hypothetical protein Ct9H90mP18_04030 [Gammaproteobacteria bacterium]